MSNTCVRRPVMKKQCESKTILYLSHDALCLVSQQCIMKAAWFTSTGLNRRRKKCETVAVGFRACFFKRIINNMLKEEIKTEKNCLKQVTKLGICVSNGPLPDFLSVTVGS